MACWESSEAWDHLGVKCHACGGPKETDAIARRRRGCDGAPKFPHLLTVGDETVELNECPTKLTSEVSEFFRVHAWSERGRLGYLFPEPELPAIVGSALDVIESTAASREMWQSEQIRKRMGKGGGD